MRPVTATNASSLAPSPAPKIVLKPSNSGSAEDPSPWEPGAMPAFRKSVRKAATTSVSRP
jgi:hypothetical protein